MPRYDWDSDIRGGHDEDGRAPARLTDFTRQLNERMRQAIKARQERDAQKKTEAPNAVD